MGRRVVGAAMDSAPASGSSENARDTAGQCRWAGKCRLSAGNADWD